MLAVLLEGETPFPSISPSPNFDGDDDCLPPVSQSDVMDMLELLEGAVAAFFGPNPEYSRGELPVPFILSPEQVQFLAYHPALVAVETWQTLLVYVSLASALEAVAANAAQFSQELGSYKRETKAMSRYPLTLRSSNNNCS